MDWLEFFSSIVASLAWPVCVVIVALLFRERLANLLAKVLKVELPGGITAEFESGLTKVEERVDASVLVTGVGAQADVGATEMPDMVKNNATPSPVPGEGSPSTETEENHTAKTSQENTRTISESIPLNFGHVAPDNILKTIDFFESSATHPTGVVMEAWKDLEFAVWFAAGAVLKLEEKPKTIDKCLKPLIDAGVLTTASAVQIQSLKRLRNLAAHSKGPVDPSEARRFAKLAYALMLEIERRMQNLS